jgi:hypothetical protein
MPYIDYTLKTSINNRWRSGYFRCLIYRLSLKNHMVLVKWGFILFTNKLISPACVRLSSMKHHNSFVHNLIFAHSLMFTFVSYISSGKAISSSINNRWRSGYFRCLIYRLSLKNHMVLVKWGFILFTNKLISPACVRLSSMQTS